MLMLIVVMLVVIYTLGLCAEGRYAERHYVECRNTERRCVESLFLIKSSTVLCHFYFADLALSKR